MLYLRAVRLHQWIKNFFVFAPLVFSRNLTNLDLVLRSLVVFAAFCVTASGVYLLNDVADYERDRVHPTKRNRPIASGAISRLTAVILGLVLLPTGVIIAFGLGTSTGVALGLYLAVNLVYSQWLKHIVLLDAFVIAFGFLLRVSAGALGIDVGISAWLLTCTLFISLFLAFCKRRNELITLGADASNHRGILAEYSTPLLDNMVSSLGGMTVMSYALYTIDQRTVSAMGTDGLVLTVPFVLYGVFRYLHLVHLRQGGGSPTLVVLKDRGMQLVILLWFLTCVSVIYFRLNVGLIGGPRVT